MNKPKVLTEIYDSLFKSFGKQYWWPGDTGFEVVIGAILTQNTNWTNVEKAIKNLKAAKVFTPKKLYEIETKKLAELIKPSGYFNVKAKRLKHFIEWLFLNYNGSLSKLFKQDFATLRKELLSVNGIGKETADSIILYAAEKPTFVVDAYTRRVLVRHGLITEDYDYEDIKSVFEDNLPGNVPYYNEYHALIVMVGKHYCKPRMQCEECPLENVHRIRQTTRRAGSTKSARKIKSAKKRK
ncbi:MAG: endonuclease III domain-containing protein [Candidatus Scalindua sp.]|jgi:endonuclease-3 related protein|nr:endonuclease [Candidatus Neomarinimicrobiota bacterium]MDP7530820.1 endonuclease III domain-containing protein [Candidatus Scalindua sp.]|tara:strand:+ start:61 stop:780 length:720 start_codon:yes stop_codon:yes gene_type:complete